MTFKAISNVLKRDTIKEKIKIGSTKQFFSRIYKRIGYWHG